jgi:diaminopropionate ammonia-lyase
LNGLARDADAFATVSESQSQDAVRVLAAHGLPTTPSGAAGVAALHAGLDVPGDASVLAILSEGPEGD